MHFTHDTQQWREKLRRVNGALTYSQDICMHYVPEIERILKDRKPGKQGPYYLSTCPMLHKLKLSDLKVNLAIQFLHTWPKVDQYEDAANVWKRWRAKHMSHNGNLILITAYKGYYDELLKHGPAITPVFQPMYISPEQVATTKVETYKASYAVYFGNITDAKRKAYDEVVKACKEAGIILATISKGKVSRSNGVESKISRGEILNLLKNASLVFAVGRCALEALALGAPVIVVGTQYAGPLTSETFTFHHAMNINARIRHKQAPSLIQAIKETLHSPTTIDPNLVYLTPDKVRDFGTKLSAAISD